MQKKNIFVTLILLVAVILMPLPKTGIKLCFTLDQVDDTLGQGEDFRVYYTTMAEPDFSGDKSADAAYDEANKLVVFTFDAQLTDELKGLRIDLPLSAELISITDVAVYSGGFARKHFNPCTFFAEGNLIATNDIVGYNLVESKGRAFFHTGDSDPYLLFSEALVQELLKYRSSYVFTKGFLCLLIVAGALLRRKVSWQ